MVPPAPARSPLSISLRPGPDVSAVLSQRAAASPAGPLAMKVEGNERQMEVPVCLCSVCLSCAYPLLNCPSGGPQRLQAQPWTLGQRYTQAAPLPPPLPETPGDGGGGSAGGDGPISPPVSQTLYLASPPYHDSLLPLPDDPTCVPGM